MRNTLSVLAIALMAAWGAINLGCAPAESRPTVSGNSTSSALAATPVVFKVKGMT